MVAWGGRVGWGRVGEGVSPTAEYGRWSCAELLGRLFGAAPSEPLRVFEPSGYEDIYIYVYIYAYTSTDICVHVYVCVYIYVCRNVYVYIHICIQIQLDDKELCWLGKHL